MRRLLVGLLTVAFCFGEDRFLFRTPTVSATEIVFSYAGDLWSVSRSGGDARRLTSHPGTEINPLFSPDGKTIAFSGEYDGSRAIYTIPSSGGVPKCLTWNHAQQDWPVDWTRDGKRILFRSLGNPVTTPTDRVKLYTVDLQGGFPDELPLPIGREGTYSPDGTHLAYVPDWQYQTAWKRYRGGQMFKIWIANLADSSVVPLPHNISNDSSPMWIGDRIYFLSDRNGPVTLFSYDLRTQQVKQLIENHGFDLKSASAGPGAIVFEQFGSIGLYDLASGKAATVPIRLASDLLEVRPHNVDVSGRLHNPDLSPNGTRAVFEARGEIISIPADKGDARNLTNTPGANEREPIWSPKGDQIAYFSDEAGECQLFLRNQSGMGEPQRFSLGKKPGYYLNSQWSPDGTKISYLDAHYNVWYLDLVKKTPVLVDQDYTFAFAGSNSLDPTWSPDGKWLAYAKTLPNHMHAIWLYSLADGKAHQVTDGMSDARSPAFDKNCKYLYFTSSTNSGPTLEVDAQSYSRSSNSNIYLIVLSKQNPSPFLTESDEENAKKETVSTNVVKVDFDEIPERTLSLPMSARSYAGLGAGAAGILYALAGDTAWRFDIASRQEKAVANAISDLVISSNGEKMLYKKDGNWIITASDGTGNDTHTLNRSNLETSVEPVVEWRQMYHEAWSIMRELFYDPGFHGIDADAIEKRYEAFVDHLATRQDLNYLLEEAFGELTVSHLFVNGGESPEVDHKATGLLGADYSIEHGRYRFKRVYSGENWNPDLRAPLTRPGVNVKAGDYLLAVNGHEITGQQNLYKVFEGLADKQVLLKVGPDPTGAAGSRQILIRTLGDERSLRYRTWLEDNRLLVDRLSKGRVAYLYMPDTGTDGAISFSRYFYAQIGKEGAIIDDRFNHGGHFATDVIDFLRRSVATGLTGRDGADWSIPPGIYGPKVMLINEFSASGGDIMPSYFRGAGVGKLVGERTWGGTVGNNWAPDLMDGGSLKVPCCAGWNPTTGYDIENHGTSPDIEVAMDPKAVREGHEPQLERAVAVVLEELAKHPLPELKKPAYPKYK